MILSQLIYWLKFNVLKRLANHNFSMNTPWILSSFIEVIVFCLLVCSCLVVICSFPWLYGSLFSMSTF